MEALLVRLLLCLFLRGFIKTEARVTFLPVTAKADPSQKAVKGACMPIADSEKQQMDVSKEKSPLFNNSVIMSCVTLLPSMVSPQVPYERPLVFPPLDASLPEGATV